MFMERWRAAPPGPHETMIAGKRQEMKEYQGLGEIQAVDADY
jgi:hypothetical protein